MPNPWESDPIVKPPASAGAVYGAPKSVKPSDVLAREKFEYEKNKESSPGKSLTPAQKKVDEAFAKDYVSWTTGGSADYRKSRTQINDALKDLDERDDITGWFVGRLPDSVNSIFNQKSIDTREAIEEVVQRNLRLVLGAQFTNEEGKRLIARAYNPSLPEATNKKRVARLLKQIDEAARAKNDAARYYEDNGTLVGWNGTLPTVSDFDPIEKKAVNSNDDDALIAKYLD